MVKKQEWGRRQSDNQAYPKHKPDKGELPQSMFGPAKYKKYSDIIRMDTPDNAMNSVQRLVAEFDKAKTDDKRLRIARVTRLAANRADATLKRKNLSVQEQREFHRIRKIYADTANEMFLEYDTPITKARIRKMSLIEIHKELRRIDPKAEIGRSDMYYKEDLVDHLYIRLKKQRGNPCPPKKVRSGWIPKKDWKKKYLRKK